MTDLSVIKNLKFRRTFVAGKLPNTTDPANSTYISAGQFSFLLADKKMVSSNGTVTFEVGSNLTNLNVSNTATIKHLYANNIAGFDGQVLKTSPNGIYWGTANGAGNGYTGSIGFTGSQGDTGFTGSQGSTGFVGSQGNIGYTGSQGTQGDTGFTGSQGIQGIQGDVGFTGSKGDNGFTGSQGIIGFTGSVGNTGFTGSQGIQGDTGFTGSQGVTGFTGSQGDIGTKGFTGSIGNLGFTGSQGIIGFTGSQGDIGTTGFTGSQGIQGTVGFTGSQGDIGFTGSQGIQGNTGFIGSKGDIGYTGSQGVKGDVGFTGSQGATGFTGSQGIQGSTGFTGSQGIQGDVGFTGSQGVQGIVGFTGSQGIQGIIGFTGSQGIQGIIGFTGSQGIVGFTGSQGIQGTTGFTGSQGVQGDIGFTGSIGDVWDYDGLTSTPASPSSGRVKQFALDLGGIILPSTIGAEGLIRVLTPNALNRASLVTTPNSGTSMSNIGAALTLTGSLSHPAPATTNYFTSHLRTRFSTNTTAGNTGGWRNNSVAECYRTYGFLHHTRFSISTLVSGHRQFVGLSNSISAPSNINPLTDTTIVKIGIGCNTNTGNLFIIHGPAGASPTTIDLGADYPVNTTDAYDLFLYAPPNGDITYVVAKLSTTDGSWTNISSAIISTNLPTATTGLLRYGMITNNATAAVASVDVLQIGTWRL